MEDSLNLSRQRRTQQLEPDLVMHPRSKGWAFDIPSCFRNALDIQLTAVVQNGTNTQVWTQGQNYNFQIGDTLYDAPEARTGAWLEALKTIKTAVEVTKARKAEPANFSKGEVTFRVLHPNPDRSALVPGLSYTGTQNDFVEFLQSGHWGQVSHNLL